MNEAKVTEPGSSKGDISESVGLSVTLTSRFDSLIDSSPIILFMKGIPAELRCGFSRKAVEILQQEKDNSVQQCLDAFLHVVSSTTPGLLETTTGDIQQMMGEMAAWPSCCPYQSGCPKNQCSFVSCYSSSP